MENRETIQTAGTVSNITKQQAMSNALLEEQSVIAELENFLGEIKGESQPEDPPTTAGAQSTALFCSLQDMLNNGPVIVGNNKQRLLDLLANLRETL